MHWLATPVAAAMAVPKWWAVLLQFFSIFVLWCIHFNALDLEFPFGTRINDLPMKEFQTDWNKSISTLLQRRAREPPHFAFEREKHEDIAIAMSDGITDISEEEEAVAAKSNR